MSIASAPTPDGTTGVSKTRRPMGLLSAYTSAAMAPMLCPMMIGGLLRRSTT
jgi:hypothetical protein